MTHTPTETTWVVRTVGSKEYGPFKSPDDARAFATQTGWDCMICEFRGSRVREATYEEFKALYRDDPLLRFLRDPSEYSKA